MLYRLLQVRLQQVAEKFPAVSDFEWRSASALR
jgi:hypothetical protein